MRLMNSRVGVVSNDYVRTAKRHSIQTCTYVYLRGDAVGSLTQQVVEFLFQLSSHLSE